MKSKQPALSPNATEPEKKMRKDLKRISNMIEYFHATKDPEQQIAIYRELLTSWQGVTAMDYQTDDRLQLNILTKRMLND